MWLEQRLRDGLEDGSVSGQQIGTFERYTKVSSGRGRGRRGNAGVVVMIRGCVLRGRGLWENEDGLIQCLCAVFSPLPGLWQEGAGAAGLDGGAGAGEQQFWNGRSFGQRGAEPQMQEGAGVSTPPALLTCVQSLSQAPCADTAALQLPERRGRAVLEGRGSPLLRFLGGESPSDLSCSCAPHPDLLGRVWRVCVVLCSTLRAGSCSRAISQPGIKTRILIAQF